MHLCYYVQGFDVEFETIRDKEQSERRQRTYWEKKGESGVKRITSFEHNAIIKFSDWFHQCDFFLTKVRIP